MKNIIAAFIIIILFSCSAGSPTIPKDTLSINEMSSILSDLHLVQLSMNDRLRGEERNVTTNEYLAAILEKHHTTKKVFLNSLKFYSQYPDMLNEVYDSVIVQLSRKEQMK